MASAQKTKLETNKVAKAQLFELPVHQLISAKRKELGINITDIAEATKISSLYLKLIEADDIHNHLERVYVLGFIRSYANELGLDGEKLVNSYKIERKWASYPANFNEPPKPQKSIRSANKGFMKYVNIRTVGFGLVVLLAMLGFAVNTFLTQKAQNSDIANSAVEQEIESDGINSDGAVDSHEVISP